MSNIARPVERFDSHFKTVFILHLEQVRSGRNLKIHNEEVNTFDVGVQDANGIADDVVVRNDSNVTTNDINGNIMDDLSEDGGDAITETPNDDNSDVLVEDVISDVKDDPYDYNDDYDGHYDVYDNFGIFSLFKKFDKNSLKVDNDSTLDLERFSNETKSFDNYDDAGMIPRQFPEEISTGIERFFKSFSSSIIENHQSNLSTPGTYFYLINFLQCLKL